MKAQYGDQAYEVLGFHDGMWVWCDSRDEGNVTLPQEVYDRLSEGLTGKFSVGEQVYWIRPTAKESSD